MLCYNERIRLVILATINEHGEPILFCESVFIKRKMSGEYDNESVTV